MSRGPVVEVEGARNLRRTLARAGDDMSDLTAANAAVSAFVAARAASAAPRRTGRLAGSVRGNKAKGTAIVRAGGASIVYAGVIHWGWAGHNIEPNPFLVETAHRTEPQWLDMYLRELNRVLSRVKGV